MPPLQRGPRKARGDLEALGCLENIRQQDRHASDPGADEAWIRPSKAGARLPQSKEPQNQA
jgi:hypothetical protein